jgi:hypothetical protein
MRKKFVWITCCLLIALMGCGNESSDPTAIISSLAAVPSDVAPGGSAIITATVVKAGEGSPPAAGATTTTTATNQWPPAWGVNVTFKLLTANGGRLSTLTQKTDGIGKAMVVYTAGNNYSQDVIQATLENGNSATVIVQKTGNIPGATVTIAANPGGVKAYGYSSITATVEDGNKPVGGETVEFTLHTNNSGAKLVVHNAVTDSLGRATATYQAGGNVPTQDVVLAKLISNGSVSSTVIAVSPSTSGYSVTLDATSTSLTSGQTSIITATVTESGSPAIGVNVAFTCSPNNSGATLNGSSSASATTDGTGKAQITYITGSESPTLTVYDTVQASVGSATSALVITRNGSGLGYAVTVTASPSSLSSATGQSTVTANVRNNSTGTAVVGILSTFSVSGTGNGTVNGLKIYPTPTDGNGNAITTYIASVSGSGSYYDTIKAEVQIDSIIYTGAVTIPITVP